MNKKIIFIVAVIIVIIVSIIIFGNNNSDVTAYLYEENGLYGLKDEDGKILTEAKYKKIIKTENVDDIFIVNNDNKYGLITSSGKEVLKVQYDNIVNDEYAYDYSKIGYVLSLKKSDGYYYGYADSNGKILFDCDYEVVARVLEYDGNDTYLILRQNGRYGVAKNSKIVIDMKYQDIFYNESLDRFIVEKNEKYGMLSRDGKELIKPECKMFGIDGEKIYFMDENRTIYYDRDGNLLEIEKKEI